AALRALAGPPVPGCPRLRDPPDQDLRHQGRQPGPAGGVALGRQPAEAGRRPPAGDPAEGVAGQPADTRGGRGLDRVHPPPAGGRARPWAGRAAGLVGAGRGALACRPAGGALPRTGGGRAGGRGGGPGPGRPADGGGGLIPRRWRRWLLSGVVVPVASVACGFLVGAVAILAAGADPNQAYTALLQGAFTNRNAFAETLVSTVPYVLLGLGVALGFRAGLFNIGAEGQFYI